MLNNKDKLKQFLLTHKNDFFGTFNTYNCPICGALRGLFVVNHTRYISGVCNVCEAYTKVLLEGVK